MRRAFLILLVALLLVSVSAPFVMAQDMGYDAQLFRPSIFGGKFLAIEGAHSLWANCYGAGFYLNYADSPVEFRIDEEFEKGILNSITTANIVGMYSPWTWFALGVDVPVHLMSRGYDFDDVETGEADEGLVSQSMLGDIKAQLRFQLLKMEKHYVGLALAGFSYFPTGNSTMLLGEGSILPGGKLMAEVDAKIFNIAANGGYIFREDREIFGTNVGSSYIFGAGVSRDFGPVGFSLEWWGFNAVSASNERVETDPMEVTATLRYTFGNKIRVLGGGGAGLTSGIGSPSYRAIAGVDWFPDCLPPSTGFMNVRVVNEEGKPLKAILAIKGMKTTTVKTNSQGEYNVETKPGEFNISAATKGYMPNSAKAVIVAGKATNTEIVLKAIPKPTILTINVVHKKSGKRIANAGILIKNLETNKLSGMKAPEGTFSSDYATGKYKITGVAAGFERVDVEATVEAEKENVVTIELRRKIIKIGKVQFAFDSAKLMPAALPVLDDVVKKIKTSDIKFKKIIIEGHTSDEGSDEYNMKLSKRRGESVKAYLVSKGISADMLEVEAFGESRPIADNATDEGKEKNRRVEFIFEE